MAKGREDRKASPQGQAHTPDLLKFYRYHLPPIHPGDFRFELSLLRPRQPALRVDHLVDALNWLDEQAAMTGSVTLHRPDAEDPSSLPITRGQLLRCRVRWAGGLYELWTMRLGAPQIQKDTNSVAVALQDDLVLLEAGSRDWIYRKTKHRPHGYFAHEIARLIAKRVGVKVGELAKGTKRMSFVKRKASALDALRAVYAEEKKNSGKSYIIRLRNGRLEVVTLRRNPIVYRFSREIQTALIAQKAGQKVPTTVLTGKAKIGKGKGAKKISYTEYDRQVVRLLGYSHDERDYGTVSSHKELRDDVKRDLAKGLRFNDTITITHAGVPFIVRGDGAEIDLPAEGYKGQQSFVWCTRTNHTVSGGVYTCDLDFNASDPYLKQWQADQKAARARAAARAKRRRKNVKK